MEEDIEYKKITKKDCKRIFLQSFILYYIAN